MRSPRKLAIALAALGSSLLVALLVVPFVFRDRIATRLKTEIGASVNARVAWDGVGLSLLRDFPNATLSLDQLSVVGVKPFERDTLVSMREARLVLDVGSVLGYLARGDRIVVREVAFRQPSLNLRVLADGTANWDIARTGPGASTDASRAVGVTLRDLRVSDGRVTLEDQQSHLSASIAGLQESLRGDFARDRFVLGTRTRARAC
ncbi:MAG: hypothetical protein ACJ8AD_18090 [Gemmatimonadaceae bacterium]